MRLAGRARWGVGILGAFALLAAGAGLLGDPGEYVGAPFLEPSALHPLGTTGQGQDVLRQVVAGTRGSLVLSLAVGALAVAVGALVGVAAGYAGGWVDRALSLTLNVVLVLPSLPLAVVVAAYLPPSPFSVGAVLVLTGWAWNARVVRAQCLALRRREFVLAARMVGESPARVVFVELLPNLGSLLLSQFIGATTYALGAHVGLEFLGLGEVSRVTWGSNLYWASNDQALLTGAWWTFVPTGLCVAAVGGALALLQGAVDEALHPQLRAEQPWRAFLGRAGRVPPPDGATPVVRQ